MNLLARFRHRAALRAYARKLGPVLRKRYGRSKTYTIDQINAACKQAGLRIDYVRYGYAMFVDPMEHRILRRRFEKEYDYQALKAEVMEHEPSGSAFSAHGNPGAAPSDTASGGTE